MSTEPWRCDVHALQVPDGDCPKCDAELIALTEQEAAATQREDREFGYVEPCDGCPRTIHHYVLNGARKHFIAYDVDEIDQLAELGRQLASQRDDLIAQGVNPADLDVPTAPVDWDSPTWGGGTHQAAWAPDGTHDDVTEEE